MPILSGWIGGIIGYFAVRHDDPRLAKRLLILGVVLSAAWIAIAVVIGVKVNMLVHTPPG